MDQATNRDDLDRIEPSGSSDIDQASESLGTPVHAEQLFSAEMPAVVEGVRGADYDGYVGPDGKMAPHQTPSEVEAERLSKLGRGVKDPLDDTNL